MIYNQDPPYEIISNSSIDHSLMRELKNFAKFFELIINRGQFKKTLKHIFKTDDPFDDFFSLSNYLFSTFKRDYSISLNDLYVAIYHYLEAQNSSSNLIKDMRDDYLMKPRKYLPTFLKQEP
jgi:hypothetical protein